MTPSLNASPSFQASSWMDVSCPLIWHLQNEISGLKAPEQTCLVLNSILSATERQEECGEPELLVALMRHKYQPRGVCYVQYATTPLLSLLDI